MKRRAFIAARGGARAAIRENSEDRRARVISDLNPISIYQPPRRMIALDLRENRLNDWISGAHRNFLGERGGGHVE